MVCVYMCCCYAIDWDLIFSGVSALASLGAFVFAIFIFNDISFKRDVRQKQLDTVVDLVKELQNLQLFFSYKFVSKSKDGSGMTYSGDSIFYFFNMTAETLKSSKLFLGSNVKVFVSEDYLNKNSIFKYVNEPLLPVSIANKLVNIYKRGGNEFDFDREENKIYISDDRAYENHKYINELSSYYQSMENLFQATEELNKSIRTWLSKHGADELNIREKPINLINNP